MVPPIPLAALRRTIVAALPTVASAVAPSNDTAAVRQLREGLFVARSYVWAAATCIPGDPTSWSVEVDTESGVAFGAGPATVRWFVNGGTGWREWFDDEGVTQITLVAS